MCAAVTADAVLDVSDTFLAVFGNDPGLLMLMATKAGVLLVIASQMACCAGGVVIIIEQEIAAVIKRRRFPVRRLVTARASQRLAAMQIILRRRVAGLASGARVVLQQGMVERYRAGLGQSRSRVIAVAGHAVGLSQRLMECRKPVRLRNCDTFGGAQADIGHDMASGAAFRRGPAERRVARKAVALERRMRRNQVAGANHFMRAHEAKGKDHRQYQRDTDP